MKAMILAAGLGTRLRPLTNKKPKALIEWDGIPLIEIVLKRLMDAGVTDVIINLHHFPEQLKNFLRNHSYFSIHIRFSYEEKLLNTGGGLKKAAFFFDEDEPFFLHNVDIISNIDLKKMYLEHRESHSLATVAVQNRETSRYLIFDGENNLCGWKSVSENKTVMTREPVGDRFEFGFCGIHVISPALLGKMTEQGAFSIIDTYLRLAGEGEKITAFRADEYEWQDIGKPEQLR